MDLNAECGDWPDHCVGDELSFLGYDFKTGAVSDNDAMRAAKERNAGGDIALDVLVREVFWLKMISYSFIKSNRLQWRQLNGEIDEENIPGIYDVPDTASFELLLQQKTDWIQDTSSADRGESAGEFKSRTNACAAGVADHYWDAVGLESWDTALPWRASITFQDFGERGCRKSRRTRGSWQQSSVTL